MTKLYLIRHGETIDNVNRIMQGQTQGELTENGRKQAQEVAARMANTDIDVFMSSDLKRSYDTCVIIAASHGKEVETTTLLRERDWGSFTGKYIPDLKDKPWPDDIESIETLKARAKEFLNLLRKSYPDKTVLAVGHGIINKAIQAVYFKKEMKDIKRMENAEVRELIL